MHLATLVAVFFAAGCAARREPRSTAPTAVDVESARDCVEALFARDDLRARGYGPNHPDIREVEARLSRCPQPVVPSAAECAKLDRDREAMVVVHGSRHPAMIATDSKLEHCSATRAR